MRSRTAALTLLLVTACTVPKLDPEGKSCDGGCPTGYACEATQCVLAGASFCAGQDAGVTSCLDFESGLALGDKWKLDTTSIPNQGLSVDAGFGDPGRGLHSDFVDGGGPLPGRIEYDLGTWSDVHYSFDFRPQIRLDSGAPGFIALGELNCCDATCHGAWLHYLDESGTAYFVLRVDEQHAPSAYAKANSQPRMGEWTRAELEIKSGASPTASLTINGTTVSKPLEACSGTWQANLGLSPMGADGVQRADYDNVVLDVK